MDRRIEATRGVILTILIAFFDIEISFVVCKCWNSRTRVICWFRRWKKGVGSFDLRMNVWTEKEKEPED